jgi:hypothetical protein
VQRFSAAPGAQAFLPELVVERVAALCSGLKLRLPLVGAVEVGSAILCGSRSDIIPLCRKARCETRKLLARKGSDTRPGTSRKEIAIVLYSCYFDASGKPAAHEFMTTAEQWGRFERGWSGILKREGVSEFHATDFAASLGEYKEWKGDKGRRSHFLRDLIAVAQKSTNKLFTGTIAMSDWRYVNSMYALEEHFFSPYAYVGFGLVNEAVLWAKKRKVPDAKFLVAFEDGDQGWGGLRNLCMKYLGLEPMRLPKKHACAFQLGDMLAWKTRITAVNATKTADVKQIDKYLARLDKLMFCPATQVGVRQRSLIANCEKLGIPKRGAP